MFTADNTSRTINWHTSGNAVSYRQIETALRFSTEPSVRRSSGDDRAAHPDDPHDLTEKWVAELQAFMLIAEVALHFKHGTRRWVKKAKLENPDALLITHPLGLEGDLGGLELHALYFLIRDALIFLREKAKFAVQEGKYQRAVRGVLQVRRDRAATHLSPFRHRHACIGVLPKRMSQFGHRYRCCAGT